MVIIGGRDRFHTSHTVVKCEGLTDGLTLHPLLPDGFVAVANICGARSGKGAKVLADVMKDTGKHLVVIHDADQPGQQGAATVARETASVAASIRCPVLPYTIEKDHGKDLRDYLNEGHTWSDLLRLIEDTQPVDQAATAEPAPVAPAPYEPFPVDTLPAVVGKYVESSAAALGCDASYVALPLLSALASAVGNTRRVRLKASWSEPCASSGRSPSENPGR